MDKDSYARFKKNPEEVKEMTDALFDQCDLNKVSAAGGGRARRGGEGKGPISPHERSRAPSPKPSPLLASLVATRSCLVCGGRNRCRRRAHATFYLL